MALAITTAYGQSKNDVYPVLKPIRYKMKNTQYGYLKVSFNGCVDGN